MANINKIRLSGQTYNIQDENASKTVELTQAQYDALTVKDPNTFYVITDAQGADLSQYYTSAQTESAITQAVSGKVDTSTFNTYSGSVDTALSGKQDTLSAGTGIDITDNVISATGGGKAIEAGRGISITTSETADTVSFNLPISAGTGSNSLLMNEAQLASGSKSIAGGQWCQASAEGALAFGQMTHACGNWCVSLGNSTIAGRQSYPFGKYSMAVNNTTQALGDSSFACGNNTISNNVNEFSCGAFNVSNSGSTDADNTLFSVGNGKNVRHNAFEIRQNGDIYISYNGNDVNLQDLIADIYSKLPTS